MFASIVKRASGIFSKQCIQLSSPSWLLLNNDKHIIGSAAIAVRFRSNRSKRGLYDGKDVGFGNQRSFSMRATRRKFKPNVFLKRLYSETFDRMIRFHVTAAALRSIDKAGGLDNYLFKKDDFVVGSEGWKVKKAIKKRRKNLAYFERTRLERDAAAAAAAGAQQGVDETNGDGGDGATNEKKMERET